GVGDARGQLQRVETGTGVAIGVAGEVLEGILVHGDVLCAQAALVSQGATEQGEGVVVGQGAEGADAGARESRGAAFEGGASSGGTDKGDGAALDVGENSILLGLVEAVDLIYEEDGAPPGHAQELAGILHDATEISDACGDSAKGDEAGVGDAGDDGG